MTIMSTALQIWTTTHCKSFCYPGATAKIVVDIQPIDSRTDQRENMKIKTHHGPIGPCIRVMGLHCRHGLYDNVKNYEREPGYIVDFPIIVSQTYTGIKTLRTWMHVGSKMRNLSKCMMQIIHQSPTTNTLTNWEAVFIMWCLLFYGKTFNTHATIVCGLTYNENAHFHYWMAVLIYQTCNTGIMQFSCIGKNIVLYKDHEPSVKMLIQS